MVPAGGPRRGASRATDSESSTWTGRLSVNAHGRGDHPRLRTEALTPGPVATTCAAGHSIVACPAGISRQHTASPITMDELRDITQHLLRFSPDALIVVDDGDRIRFANETVTELFGYAPEC